MGNFIHQLRSNSKGKPQANNLLNQSIAKLREYYGSFKSVCDTFSIGVNDFDQIFSSNQTAFGIWDTDGNGHTDALELFAGLILFSDSRFEDKLTFLFDIFDFNEMNYLTIMDLEFLLICCANATFKIYGIRQEIAEDTASQFLNNYFSDESKIDLPMLTKWCAKVREVSEFLEFIGKQLPDKKKVIGNQIRPIANIEHDQRYLFHGFLCQNAISGQNNLLSQQQQQQQQMSQNGISRVFESVSYRQSADWLSTLQSKLFMLNQDQQQLQSQQQQPQQQSGGQTPQQGQQQSSMQGQQPPSLQQQTQQFNQGFSSNTMMQSDVSVKINWVYGYRNQGAKQFMQYRKNAGEKAASEKIVYFTSNIIVLFFPKLCEQKYYLEHDQEVISLAMAQRPQSSMMASGELGAHPAIHIWDSNTLQNIGIVRGLIQTGVHLLQFIKTDQYLVACGIRQDSPIIIYNIKDFSVVLSTYCPEFALELCVFKNYAPASKMSQQMLQEQKQQQQQQQQQQTQQQQFTQTQQFQYENSFVVCSETKIMLFYYFLDSFEVLEMQVDEFDVTEELICATIYRIKYNTSNFKQLSPSSQGQENAFIIVSGHKGGRIVQWENFDTVRKQIDKYQSDVICLDTCRQGVIIALADNVIYQWDLQLKEELRCIALPDIGAASLDGQPISAPFVVVGGGSGGDLSAGHMGLISPIITNLYVSPEDQQSSSSQAMIGGISQGQSQTSFYKCFVATLGGDFLELELPPIAKQNQQQQEIKVHRYNQITALIGELSSMCIVQSVDNQTEQLIYAAGENCTVFCFSMESHEIIDMWVYEKPIVAMDCTVINISGESNSSSILNIPIIAIAFDDGEIIIRKHSLNAKANKGGDNNANQSEISAQNQGANNSQEDILENHTLANQRITCMRFSNGNAQYLIVGTDSRMLFVFQNSRFNNMQNQASNSNNINIILQQQQSNLAVQSPLSGTSPAFYQAANLQQQQQQPLSYGELLQAQSMVPLLGKYFQDSPVKGGFDDEMPVSIDFGDDSSKACFLIGTSQRRQLKVEMPELKHKNIIKETEKINCTCWHVRFPFVSQQQQSQHPMQQQQQLQQKHGSNTIEAFPCIIGGDVKIMLAAGENGLIYFWRDQNQLESNAGGYLKGHTSGIQQLIMTKMQNLFFSMGSLDHTIIEWRIEKQQELDMPRYLNTFIGGGNELTGAGGGNKKQQEYVRQLEQLRGLNDDTLIRELVYCSSTEVGKTNSFVSPLSGVNSLLLDSFLLFRGVNEKVIYQIYQESSQVLQPFDDSKLLHHRPPPVSVHLEFIYGFQSYDRRKTIFYGHIYFLDAQIALATVQNRRKQILLQQQQQQNQKGNTALQGKQQFDQQDQLTFTQQQKTILIPQEYQKEMLIAKQSLLPYDEQHEGCQRQLIYYVSRFVVVYDPLTHRQRFYEGHQHKVCCIAIHPKKFLVASSEVSPAPTIHIWSVANPEVFKVIRTTHKNGITLLTFSRDASLILSVGMDRYFSLQVTSWKSEEILAVRNSGPSQIFDVQFNPYNRYEFTTCGLKNITVWEVNGRNILRKQVVNLSNLDDLSKNVAQNKVTCITCVAYISYVLGDQIESDIIAANNFGDLILMTCGKHIVARERAHQKMINCLKIAELFKDKILILTAGEDEYVRIWDTKFNLVNDIALRKTGLFHELPPIRSLAPQSLDIFQCRHPTGKAVQQSHNKSPEVDGKGDLVAEILPEDTRDIIYPIILIGTRNGDILEAAFQLEFQGQTVQKVKGAPESLTVLQQQNREGGGGVRGRGKSNGGDGDQQDQKSSSSSNSSNGDEDEEEDDNEGEDDDNEEDDNTSSKGQAEDQDQIEEEKKEHQALDKLINQKKSQLYGQQEQFKFSYSIYLRNHASHLFNIKQQNKKVVFTLHPLEKILVTVGEDHCLMIFDTTNNKLLYLRYLELKPTTAKFSPEGQHLAIGFLDGSITIFNFEVEKQPNAIMMGTGSTQGMGPNSHHHHHHGIIGGSGGSSNGLYSIPTVQLFQEIKEKEEKAAVLSIVFSSSVEMFAVSFDSLMNKQKELNKQTSLVRIYALLQDNNEPEQGSGSGGNEILYKKQTEIVQLGNPLGKENVSSEAVQFLSFTADGQYLVLCYQDFDQSQIRINSSNNLIYFRVYDIKNQDFLKQLDILKNSEWEELIFPNNVASQYQAYQGLILEPQDVQGKGLKDNANSNQLQSLVLPPMMSSMQVIQDDYILIGGSVKGDIHLAKANCLYIEKVEMVNENMKRDKMCLAKSYAAHTSYVSQCEVAPQSRDSLYTTSMSDECVLKWRFCKEDENWDWDYLDYQLEDQNCFNEVVSKDIFYQINNSFLPLRKDITIVMDNVDFSKHMPISLNLHNVIGRKAFNQRNNLFYDYYEDIMYLIGGNLVIISKESFIYDGAGEGDQSADVSEDEKDRQGGGNREGKSHKFHNHDEGMLKDKNLKTPNKVQIQSQQQQNSMLPSQSMGSGQQNKLSMQQQGSSLKKNLEDYSQQNYKKQQQQQMMSEDNQMREVEGDLSQSLSKGKKADCIIQDFIQLDVSPKSTYPEISCITLSKSKSLLCAGTVQLNAQILVWDICSRTQLHSLALSNTNCIQMVKFAYDNRHIACVALSTEYTQVLYIIDALARTVLCSTNFLYSAPIKILHIDFFPYAVHKLVTCGVQHMAVWNLKGAVLSYYNLQIENPPDLVLDEALLQNNQQYVLRVTFLCAIFIFEAIISAGDDGYLYVWDDQIGVVKKQNAHPHSPILCLATQPNSNMFVSGGTNGCVIIWQLNIIDAGSAQYNLEKFYEYNVTYTPDLMAMSIPNNQNNANNNTTVNNLASSQQQQQYNNPEHQIQSVCIGSTYILAGTRSGDIYELIRPTESEQQTTTKENRDMVKLRYNCSDQEVPRTIQFSGNSDKLYILSQNGLFSVWEIATLKRLFQRHYKRDTQSLIVFRKSQKILLALTQEVIFLDNSQADYPAFPKAVFKFKATISDIKLAVNEQILAVALAPQQEQNAKIEIYKAIDNGGGISNENNMLFEKMMSFDNLSTSLEFIDFSTDNFYLLYKDNYEEVAIIDLASLKRITEIYMEFNIEWCSDGIKVTDKAKGINSYYNEENKILKITKLGEKAVAVTDQMGTIRIFHYPCDASSGQGYSTCLAQHLNIVNQCVISPDKKYLVTSSEVDRSVLIWYLHQEEEDLNKINEQ